jgi:hypothetical protein
LPIEVLDEHGPAIQLRPWSRGLICFKALQHPVGASSLAMIANDYACYLYKRGAFTSFASKLAPTGNARAIQPGHF